MTESKSNLVRAETRSDQLKIWDISGRILRSLDAEKRVDLQQALDTRSLPGKMRLCGPLASAAGDARDAGCRTDSIVLPDFGRLLSEESDVHTSSIGKWKPSLVAPFEEEKEAELEAKGFPLYRDEEESSFISYTEEEMAFLVGRLSDGTWNLEEDVVNVVEDNDDEDDGYEDYEEYGIESLIGN